MRSLNPERPLRLPVKLSLEGFHFLFHFIEEYNKGGRRLDVTCVIRDVSSSEGRDHIGERRSAVRVLTQG
jgi:hypothetical protein